MFRSVREGGAGTADMTVIVNGVETPAWHGETVASVILRVPDAGRRTPKSNTLRHPYCQMGVCFECLVMVDGKASLQGCLVLVVPGMRIDDQHGARGVGR